MSLSAGLSQNRLVKIRTDISRELMIIVTIMKQRSQLCLLLRKEIIMIIKPLEKS